MKARSELAPARIANLLTSRSMDVFQHYSHRVAWPVSLECHVLFVMFDILLYSLVMHTATVTPAAKTKDAAPHSRATRKGKQPSFMAHLP